MRQQESFYQHIFRSFHREHRIKENRPESTGEALSMLREHTGVSWEELARLIGVLPSTVTAMVRRNSKLPLPVLAACCRMAREYDLPVLEDWLNKYLMKAVRTQRRTKSDEGRPEDRKYYDEIR